MKAFCPVCKRFVRTTDAGDGQRVFVTHGPGRKGAMFCWKSGDQAKVKGDQRKWRS